MSTTTAIPVSRSQAAHIVANVNAYADRPILVAWARMFAASTISAANQDWHADAAGLIDLARYVAAAQVRPSLPARRCAAPSAKPKLALRVIEGGLSKFSKEAAR